MSTLPSAILLPQPIWDNDVGQLPETAGEWLLPGFIARGNITLLTSLWKTGKTTLLMHLLSRRFTRQPLLGRELTAGKSVVVSEEPRGLWADRCRRFPLGGNVCLWPQPFPRLPYAHEWQALLDRVAELHARHGVDLLVIDSLTHFLRGENVSQCVLDTLLPLRALAARGLAVLVMHHPRRKDAGAGIAGRGHGAVHSEVDISIEMRLAGDTIDSRARRFFCMSRHAETPRSLLFELNEEGTDYVVLPERDDTGFPENWHVLRLVLEHAPQKLTRLDILDEWPDDFAKPNAGTLARWLEQAVSDKQILMEGKGHKADPFRYWLAEAEARWRESPLYDHLEQQAKDLKLPFVSLREHKRRSAESEKSDWDAPLPKGMKLWPPGSPEE